MRRWLLVVALAWIAWMIDPAPLFAQGTGDWPPFPLDPDLKQFQFGPGYYLSTWKIVSCWLLFVAWAFSTDWLSQDCQQHKLDYGLWNSIVFFVFVHQPAPLEPAIHVSLRDWTVKQYALL